jgi:hypothetical protein
MRFSKFTKRKAREERRWALFRLGVVLVLSVIAFVIIWGGRETPNNGQKLVMDHKIPSITEYYPQALAEARKWRPDAYMVDADVHIRDSDILGSIAFDSAEDPKVGFMFYIRGGDTGFEVETREIDASGRIKADPEIGSTDWKVDSIEVARIAYENGGKTFLKEYPEVNTLLLQLTRLSGSAAERTGLAVHTIIWRAAFYRLGEVYLNIYIDPMNGEVLATDVREGGPDIEQLNLGDDA